MLTSESLKMSFWSFSNYHSAKVTTNNPNFQLATLTYIIAHPDYIAVTSVRYFGILPIFVLIVETPLFQLFFKPRSHDFEKIPKNWPNSASREPRGKSFEGRRGQLLRRQQRSRPACPHHSPESSFAATSATNNFLWRMRK